MEIKTLENGYFIDKQALRVELGYEPFLHTMREFVELAQIEDYANSFYVQPEYLAYFIIDLQRILELFILLTNIFIDDYIKIWNNDSLKDALQKFFVASRYLPIDKYNSVYDYLPGDTQRRIAWLIENLMYPHSLLMDKIDTAQDGYAQYWELYNRIDTDINKAFASAPASLQYFEPFLASAQEAIAATNWIFDFAARASIIGKPVASLVYSYVIPEVENKAASAAGWVENKAASAAGWAEKKAADTINSIGDLLSSFLWTAGISVSIFYLARLSIDRIFTKKNPPDYLFDYAKRLKRDITKSDFNKAISVFRSQHGRLPEKTEIKMVQQPPGVNLPICVEVGRIPEITYDPPRGRKGPYKYKHDMYDTKLVSDISGNSLFLLGRTYLDTSDGWLKK